MAASVPPTASPSGAHIYRLEPCERVADTSSWDQHVCNTVINIFPDMRRVTRSYTGSATMIKVNNVSHILYPVTDVAKSVEFLSNVLGLYVQSRGSTTYLGCNDTLLEVVQAQPGREPATLYAAGFAVDNLDDALAELKAQGIEVVREPWNARTFWGRQAVIRDPGGANIALREWRAPDGPHFAGWQPE